MKKKDAFRWIDEHAALFADMAERIWDNPELPYGETFASGLQADTLKEEGFTVSSVPGIPTAFVAEYGKGHPVLGVTGEFDALKGQSQKKGYHRGAVTEGGPGHGCGHNLLGTGGLAAVIAARHIMERESLPGTLRYYGCPAEELVSGKVFMAREGVFDDLDACLSWHPSSLNTVWGCRFLALNSVMFRFSGTPAHAAASPDSGRSALDAVELMNVGANYLREHIPEKTRLHYIITDGGDEPNIVPASAAVWYYVRAPRRDQVDEVFSRLLDVAAGAALMTGTKVRHSFVDACYDVMPNRVLGDLLHANLVEAGPPEFEEEDFELARRLSGTFPPEQVDSSLESLFAPPEYRDMVLHTEIMKNQDEGKILIGSTDQGDVSHIVPFAQFTTATWPIGTASHSWQATAASGSPGAYRAMRTASKTLAGALIDLLLDDGSILAKAGEEFRKTAGRETYSSPLPPGLKIDTRGV